MEIEELLESLIRQGWQAEACDMPVPLFENPIRAGLPTELLDEVQEEYVLMPKKIVGAHPVFRLTARGDSMLGAGIDDGDKLTVEAAETANNGDIVVAMVNGGFTVKVFYRDRSRKIWLLPRNDKYPPIEITPNSELRIFGRVIEVSKAAPIISFDEMDELLASARRAKGKAAGRPKAKELSELLTSDCTAADQAALREALQSHQGKDLVFILRAACSLGWLKELPSYSVVKNSFGNIISKSTFYLYQDVRMTEREEEMALEALGK